MKLSEAYVGRPVLVDIQSTNQSNVGHITGFGLNSTKEIIIRVHCATGDEVLLHPVNVKPLEADSGYLKEEDGRACYQFIDTSQ